MCQLHRRMIVMLSKDAFVQNYMCTVYRHMLRYCGKFEIGNHRNDTMRPEIFLWVCDHAWNREAS